jgi:hypothetical protein
VSLGVDVFVPVGTVVVAPASCLVLSARPAEGIIVLRLRGGGDDVQGGGGPLDVLVAGVDPDPGLDPDLDPGLTRPSDRLAVAIVEAGQAIGRVRAPEQAVSELCLPPHVRIQAMVSDVGLGAADGDADAGDDRRRRRRSVVSPELPPSSCPVALAPAWLTLCPCPAALLGLPETAVRRCPPPTGPSSLSPSSSTSAQRQGRPNDDDGALVRRLRHFARVQEHYFDRPPQIERGFGCYLYDTSGRAYLDMVSGSVSGVRSRSRAEVHPDEIYPPARDPPLPHCT